MSSHEATEGLLGLPEHLGERALPLNECPIVRDGAFVLCWLHHAVRDHENPALDAALSIGNAIDRPVLVYQGLAGRHRFNSDRHHAFILEGACDVASGLASRDIAYAFHCPTDPGAQSPIRSLAGRACAVVTEDFPAPPFPAWSSRLASRIECAMIAVDASCVMPMRLLRKRHTRAFAFRGAAKKEWRCRIREPWVDIEPSVPAFSVDAASLGFKPVRFESLDVEALCASCDIDHSVPPVRRVRGGSLAGYERWDAFVERGLRRYDKRRNDAADMDAVSCMSPYLHYGHVSPFRIARAANEIGGSGADKFLDELLVWRELAFNFCAHTPSDELETLAALPEWAQQTLEDHADDERDALHTWETLSRGATGDVLWDAAQQSLLWNGELHNNLRMTWGKALPRWVGTASESLRLLIDLNHRFALDGNNPNSYGGLLWCLGQFDRPFQPEQSIMGTIRERTTEVHASRLDPARYASAVRSRHASTPLRVGVIGAGISGLACARVLRDHRCGVSIFDRGRGPGGRMSSRHMTTDDGREVSFDHGAPYFEVMDARFGRYVRSWVQDGVCAQWDASVRRWRSGESEAVDADRRLIVGMPGMNEVCRHVGSDLDVAYSTSVVNADWAGDAWWLDVIADGATRREGPFDVLVIGATLAQAARVAGHQSEMLQDAAASHEMVPTWVCMVEIDHELDGDVIEVSDDPAIEKLVREDTKPGRSSVAGGSRWVVHARADWSDERHDFSREEVWRELTEELIRLVAGMQRRQVCVGLAVAHRWGLARPTDTIGESCLVDKECRLVVCGDGFGGSGVEAAFLSGHAAAGRVMWMRPAATTGSAQVREASLFDERSA